MSDLLDDLITLHAAHGLQDIKTVSAFQALCATHDDDPGFRLTLNMVRDIQEELEAGLIGTPKEQVEFALETVSGYRLDATKLRICRGLVERRYARFWTTAQAEHFVEASCRLSEWNHFFLSFTTYQPSKGEVLRINSRHRRLIDHGLQQVFEPPVTQQQNLLARLLNYLLKNYNLEGFFYTEHHDDRPVEQRLIDEASRSLAFVQVLQSTMFARPSPNYCKLEYDAAAADNTARLVFVMSEPREDFVKSRDIDARLRKWHEAATTVQAVPVPVASEQAEVEDVLATLERTVVSQVRAARDRLFEEIPD